LPPVPPGSGPVVLGAGQATEVKDGQAVIDRVVAVVNGEVIMMSELQEHLVMSQRDGRAPEGDSRDHQKALLDRMIDHRLQVQAARREKLEVTEDELRLIVDDWVKRNGGDREKLEVQLRALGISWDTLRRELKENQMAQRVVGRHVRRRATATEAEVDQYLAENRGKLEQTLKYHARHIAVLAEPPDQTEAWDRAKGEIDAIVASVAAGADFATLARERSKDPSAESGGDLGWLARGELEPLFETPVLTLRPGQVTAPIKSRAGYHLFFLVEREELTPQALAEARQQARDLLLQKKAQARLEEWLESLRRRAQIAIRL
jgi:parvulin-like peptidyl-prolyl isomerase